MKEENEQSLQGLALARGLMRVDFSVESRVRLSLRSRLLALEKARVRRADSGIWNACLAGLWRLPMPMRATAVAVGVLLVLGLATTRRPSRPPTRLASHGIGAMPRPRKVVIRIQRPPRGESALPILPGRFAYQPARAEKIFSTLPAGRLIATTAGREVLLPDGRAVAWEIDGTTFMLERRLVSIEDIFEKPTM